MKRITFGKCNKESLKKKRKKKKKKVPKEFFFIGKLISQIGNVSTPEELDKIHRIVMNQTFKLIENSGNMKNTDDLLEKHFGIKKKYTKLFSTSFKISRKQ